MSTLGKKLDYLDTKKAGAKRMLRHNWIYQFQHFLRLKQESQILISLG